MNRRNVKRTWLIISIIVLVAYEQFAFFYFKTNEFAYYAVVPILVILLTAFFIFRLYFKQKYGNGMRRISFIKSSIIDDIDSDEYK